MLALLNLELVGMLLILPGIRSFVLEKLDHRSIAEGFIEFRKYSKLCHYRECQHNGEPKCAIHAAVQDGNISERRYQSYLSILSGKSGRDSIRASKTYAQNEGE